MISVILCLGIVAVLVTALVKGISDTLRGLVCWTFSSMATVISAVVYFSFCNGFEPHLYALPYALAGLGIVAVILFTVELLSPAKRFRGSTLSDYDKDSAEQSFNIVMVIIASAGAVSACSCEFFDSVQYSVLGIVPSAAVSLRQLSFFLYRVKLDTLSADRGEKVRVRLLKELDSHKRGL